MIARSIWYFAVLAIAVIAVGTQLDRQARRAPEVASYVPDAFRGFSQAPVVARHLGDKDADAASREARKLVARRPMRAENLRLLAQAQALSDQPRLAADSIQQAARRGWRDPIAQDAAMLIAIEAGNNVEAARRLAALWILSRDRQRLSEISPIVLADAEARSEFDRLLGHSGRLRQRYGASSAAR